jgi:hypothetical protein
MEPYYNPNFYPETPFKGSWALENYFFWALESYLFSIKKTSDLTDEKIQFAAEIDKAHGFSRDTFHACLVVCYSVANHFSEECHV